MLGTVIGILLLGFGFIMSGINARTDMPDNKQASQLCYQITFATLMLAGAILIGK